MTYTFCIIVFVKSFMGKSVKYGKKLHSLALDDLESSVNQKLTKRLITSHCSVNWQQYCEYDDKRPEFLLPFLVLLGYTQRQRPLTCFG